MKKTVSYAFFCFLLFSTVYLYGQIGDLEEITLGKIELKYPVVLVHGLARNDKADDTLSWGRIPLVLREYGVEVYLGNTEAWADTESNAELLKATIDSVLENSQHEKVNIIAHSKGGIDSRYLIWKYDYGDRIASLITISTPHGGSEIADFFSYSGIIRLGPVMRRLQDVSRIFGNQNLDIYSVNQDLTTEKMRDFNEKVTRDERVFYQSIYSVLNDPKEDSIYSLSHAFIKSANGENDGLVSAESASWGDNPIRIPISISHRQITDYDGSAFYRINIPGVYLEIVRELGWMGF